jgi:alpha-mannosidase
MTTREKLHLICNAHIDPVWLWEWQEGAAEAISTFRVAAELCEQFEGFMFNHNEVILYQWVEEFEPALFKRIQKLVKAGKWHIMGGWYLQPDCNMPSGEAFVRQILLGRRYFWEKFGVEPRTAINFDPFGHSRGLVQIMAKAGYDSYLFCRPDQTDCPLPGEDFEWVGFDGSTVTGHRSLEWYNSSLGGAARKVTDWLEKNPPVDGGVGLLLWGVGNHGGGPSRLDVENLKALIEEYQKSGSVEIAHSSPEAYFEELRQAKEPLPRFEAALNSWAPGCYTSQVRIKQRHRLLENELFMTEKMSSQAAIQGLLPYPATDFQSVMQDLAFAEFHDILPGSSVQPVEEAALRLMDHGLEILSRLKTRTFFALAGGQLKAEEGTIPILAYNPHPYIVEQVFECEFQRSDPNWKDEFSYPHLYQGDREVPCQAEHELSNLSLDWRKRAVFKAQLQPSQMNRFDCRLEVIPARPKPELPEEEGCFIFKTAELEILVNRRTGLVDRYRVNGIDYLETGAFLPLVMEDNEDPWGSTVQSFRQQAGAFELMNVETATRFSGVTEQLAPVRVIEDGPVRSVVEAVFSYGDSRICQRYKLPKQGTEIELEIIVFWNEKSRMLKLSVPSTLREPDVRYLGQVAFGVEGLAQTGREVVAQKWTGLFDRAATGRSLSCINDGSYGSDCKDGEIRLSLMRSAAYSSLPIFDRPLMAQDRFTGRIDQGERHFHFWLNAGLAGKRMAHIDREALAHNEKPYALSFFPAGFGEKSAPVLTLGDEVVQLSAFKRAFDSEDEFIVRLFEPTGQARTTTLRSRFWGWEHKVGLKPFELKTFRLNSRKIWEVSLLENRDL